MSNASRGNPSLRTNGGDHHNSTVDASLCGDDRKGEDIRRLLIDCSMTTNQAPRIPFPSLISGSEAESILRDRLKVFKTWSSDAERQKLGDWRACLRFCVEPKTTAYDSIEWEELSSPDEWFEAVIKQADMSVAAYDNKVADWMRELGTFKRLSEHKSDAQKYLEIITPPSLFHMEKALDRFSFEKTRDSIFFQGLFPGERKEEATKIVETLTAINGSNPWFFDGLARCQQKEAIPILQSKVLQSVLGPKILGQQWHLSGLKQTPAEATPLQLVTFAQGKVLGEKKTIRMYNSLYPENIRGGEEGSSPASTGNANKFKRQRPADAVEMRKKRKDEKRKGEGKPKPQERKPCSKCANATGEGAEARKARAATHTDENCWGAEGKRPVKENKANKQAFPKKGGKK